MADRTESEILSGLLHVTIGGKVCDCPTLKAGHVVAWNRQMTVADDPGKPLSEWSATDAIYFGESMTERLLDAVSAYDVTSALGGREWLAQHADPAELRTALEQMAANAFPFGNARGLVDLWVKLGAEQSVRPNTTNGSSPTGTSLPNRSARRSTRNR
jgi:hypothetical protein